MIRSHAQGCLWPSTLFVTLGCALFVQGCSGKVQPDSICPAHLGCGGVGGLPGGKAEGGSAAMAASAADSGAGNAASPNCDNQVKDPDESDADCGGESKCERCLDAGRCTTDTDCASALCLNKHCATPTCIDRIQDQNESDIDCGGSCRPCDSGSACLVDDDCSSQYCSKRVCADHCLSGARESDETDTDCGGSTCSACADDQRCIAASDCQSLVCDANRCKEATCSDGVRTRDESDIDCGGACRASDPCPVAAHCTTQADCESWLCSANGKCLADIVIPPVDMIDDFEDGNVSLPASPALGGRVGNWYAYGDGSGVSVLESHRIQRGGSSAYGLHVTGQDFQLWGSGVGVDLSRSGGAQSTKVPYDASSYQGVTFWARAQSPTKISVLLPDADTDAAGNICTSCAHHYYQTVEVGTDWQRFTIAFSELVLEPGGAPRPTAFKASAVVSLMLGFAPGQQYDFYLDDVAFVKH